MNLNTCPASVDFAPKELLIDWQDNAINSKQWVKAKPGIKIGYGELVKLDSMDEDGLTAIVDVWAAGDDVYGISTCCVDTTAMQADGKTPCNDHVCVLRTHGKVRAGSIVWPADIAEADKAAAILFMREDRHIFVNQTV